MTVRQGTYWNATKCAGFAEETTNTMMSFFLARFPGMLNGGTYGCRNIAGTTILSTHATGRSGDTMTGTGAPTRESLFLVEQMRVFSKELGVQGLIHHKKQWWCNRGTVFTVYNGSNPHENHIHWERIPSTPLTASQVQDVFVGPAITGNKLTAAAVVEAGMNDGGRWGPVQYVQNRLGQHGFSLVQDGVCGPLTVAAIRTFQKLCGLSADGVAGAVTQGRLQ